MKKRIANIAVAIAAAFTKERTEGALALSPEEKLLVEHARRVERRKRRLAARWAHVLKPHGDRETSRRRRQIVAGRLTTSNGLVLA